MEKDDKAVERAEEAGSTASEATHPSQCAQESLPDSIATTESLSSGANTPQEPSEGNKSSTTGMQCSYSCVLCLWLLSLEWCV